MEKVLAKNYFVFNPSSNGGESVSLTTLFFDNGDKNDESIFTRQKLSMASYGNEACFNLEGCAITPESLRELANQLEQAMNRAIAIRDEKV